MLIHPIDLYEFNRKYIVIWNTQSSVESIIDLFLEKAKVDPQKYAGQMLQRVIMNFLREYDDLQYIFEEYYQEEYADFEEYLYKNLLIEKEEVEFLVSMKKSDEKLCLVDLKFSIIDHESNLFSFEEEDLLLKINSILEEI